MSRKVSLKRLTNINYFNLISVVFVSGIVYQAKRTLHLFSSFERNKKQSRWNIICSFIIQYVVHNNYVWVIVRKNMHLKLYIALIITGSNNNLKQQPEMKHKLKTTKFQPVELQIIIFFFGCSYLPVKLFKVLFIYMLVWF